MTDQEATAEELLRAVGADIPHPGGTLLEHLRRVRDRLADWDAPQAVRTAGLCHAVYGTDGFPAALFDITERPRVRAAIGGDAEDLVYLYGSCSRQDVYPQLGQAEVAFVDRFTGRTWRPDRASLAAFVEITAANELDVITHNADLASRWRQPLVELLTRAQHHLSPGARLSWGIDRTGPST